MKNTKKVVALLLAVTLLVGAAVGATIAWLTDSTGAVTNTFTSAKLFANATTDFTLWEHEAVDANSDGQYELNESVEVKANAYTILPGVDIPKNPTVDVENLLEDGYLYIKEVENLPEGLSYEIDPENWEALTGYNGIWVYKGAKATNNVIKAHGAPQTFTVNILKDQTVKVADTYNGTANGQTLTFTAYMVQATGNGANAAAAWVNTFGAPATP